MQFRNLRFPFSFGMDSPTDHVGDSYVVFIFYPDSIENDLG